MQSYNNRAHEGKDWHRGQVGVFAFAEQLNLVKSLHTLLEYDILIVSNKCLRGNERTVLTKIGSFLSGSELDISDQQLESALNSNFSPPIVSSEFSAQEISLLEIFDSYGVGNLFSHPDPYHISDIDSITIEKIMNISDNGLDIINRITADTIISKSEYYEYMSIFKEYVEIW